MARAGLILSVIAAFGLAASAALAQQSAAKPRQIFEITVAENLRNATGDGAYSGRLVVFLGPAEPKIGPTLPAPSLSGSLPTPEAQRAMMQDAMARVNFIMDAGRPGEGRYVAAMDVVNVKRGDTIRFDADLIAKPAGFSTLPPGDYTAFAVLDTDNNLAYTGQSDGGDLNSPPVRVTLGAGNVPKLVLGGVYPYMTPWPGLDNMPVGRQANPHTVELREHTRDLDFVSPSLSKFFGKETHVRGWVLLPPGYDESRETYPTVYQFAGFGAELNTLSQILLGERHDPMYGKPGSSLRTTPPMIWVFLDHSWSTGTHEFADSANNGPWGKALTEELIPWLEKQYRMDAKPSGRLLTGHSSGGWAALWLQVKYPKLFGGAWPTAPDPTDFRDFTNTNLYTPNANVFYGADGSETPLVREADKITSFKAYSDFEGVMGSVGGQLASFEWVFSPKGVDGKPRPLFDRKTGKVDTAVARHWRDNYDIAHYIRTNWAGLKPDLDGKIHLAVGTADTYYLDRSARLLKETLDSLGAESEFAFLQGKDHGNLDVDAANAIAMYRVARPDSDWQPKEIPRPAPRQTPGPSLPLPTTPPG